MRIVIASLALSLAAIACSSPRGVRSGDRDGGASSVDGGDWGDGGGPADGARPTPTCDEFTAEDCGDPEATDLMRTRDSDSDGLNDYEEVCEYATDPCTIDSDGDGITDLGEVAAGTDPNDAASTIPEGDFFVVLPYEGDREDRTLRFGTDIEIADVFFLVDMTGSMRGERTNLINGLLDVIIPGIQTAIPNVQFGAGGFDDYPYGSYGGTRDLPFYLLREIAPFDQDLGAWSLAAGPTTCPSGGTNDIGEITGDPNGRPDILEAVEGLPCHSGADGPESYVPALYSTATGMGLDWPGGSIPGQTCPSIPDEPGARRGYPCFRPGALPIVLIFGDAPYHNGPGGTNAYSFGGPTYEETVTELNAIGARVIGIYSTFGGTVHMDYLQTATDTGAVRSDGSPLGFTINSDGTGLDTAVVDAVAELVGGTPQDVSTRTENVPGNPDEFDATLFIKSIIPLEGYRDGIAGTGYDSKDETTFYGVIPGTAVDFTIDFWNDVRPPAASAQIFEAKIFVVGNGVADLDSRNVYIIVPPEGGTILI